MDRETFKKQLLELFPGEKGLDAGLFITFDLNKAMRNEIYLLPR